MTLEYYIKVIIWNVRSTTQSNCPGIFSQCYLFNVRKGTSCELSLNVFSYVFDVLVPPLLFTNE